MWEKKRKKIIIGSGQTGGGSLNLWEILFTSAGLSLDVYAVAICKGAVIKQIDRKKLAQMCLIFTSFQMCALLLGNLFMLVPAFAGESRRISLIWYVLAGIIFLEVGGYMLYKGIRKEQIFERLEPWGSAKEMCLLSIAVSVDAFLTGIGFAFVETSLLKEVIAVGVLTVAAVILGIITGYRLGYEQKHKVHTVGGLILMAAGIEVFVNYLR